MNKRLVLIYALVVFLVPFVFAQETGDFVYRVFEVKNSNTGGGISGASIEFGSASHSVSRTTDTNGIALIGVYFNSYYSYTISHNDYNTKQGTIQASGGYTFRLTPKSTSTTSTKPIKVKITDTNTGAAIQGASVTLRQDNIVKGSSLTGADGYTSCITVDSGLTVVMSISKTGYNPRSASMGPYNAGTTCSSAGSYALTPTTQPWRNVKLYVKNSNGQYITTATVRFREGSQTGPLVGTGLRQSDNSYSTSLETGKTYYAEIDANGYNKAWRSFTLSPGSSTFNLADVVLASAITTPTCTNECNSGDMGCNGDRIWYCQQGADRCWDKVTTDCSFNYVCRVVNSMTQCVAPTTALCKDYDNSGSPPADGEISTRTKSYVKYNNVDTWDACHVNPTYVNEQYCTTQDTRNVKAVKCPLNGRGGYMVCNGDGKCVDCISNSNCASGQICSNNVCTSSTIETGNTCIDSDSADGFQEYERYRPGKIAWSRSASGLSGENKDECQTGGWQLEYICIDGLDGSRTIQCLNGCRADSQNGGYCVCASNSDCGEGYSCINGLCSQGLVNCGVSDSRCLTAGCTAQDDVDCVASPSCTINADCNDGNQCTSDACVFGTCDFDDKPDGISCTGGTCQSGTCVSSSSCDNDGTCEDSNGETCSSCPQDCRDKRANCAVGEICRANGICTEIETTFCEDSDSGHGYQAEETKTSGTVTFSRGSASDRCDFGVLTEYFCDQWGSNIIPNTINCETLWGEGYRCVTDGLGKGYCAFSSTPTEEECVDTDSSQLGIQNYEIYTPGSVFLPSSDEEGVVNEFKDECQAELVREGEYYVLEHFCTESNVRGDNTRLCPTTCDVDKDTGRGFCVCSSNSDCEDESICTDGRCVEEFGGSACEQAGYKCTSGIRGCGQYETKDLSCNSDSGAVICCEDIPSCGDGICFEHDTPGYGETSLSCPQDCGTSDPCVDTDGGIDFFNPGELTVRRDTGRTVEYEDECLDEDYLSEYYCAYGRSVERRTMHLCVNGCVEGEGVCRPEEIEGCFDSDNGRDLYTKGRITDPLASAENLREDECLGNGDIRELFCNEEGIGESDIYTCPYGCSEGACILFRNLPGGEVPSVQEPDGIVPATDQSDDTEEPTVSCVINGACEGGLGENFETCPGDCTEVVSSEECQYGCLYEDLCLPIGTRVGNLYCSLNEEMIEQRNGGFSCENNFECGTNVCADNTCIEQGLLNQLFDLLASLLGLENNEIEQAPPQAVPIYGVITSESLCVPYTCELLDKECGSWSNGCTGGNIYCGTCQDGYSCVNGHCVV